MRSSNPNSAVNWWPKINNLPVPKPDTEFIDVSEYEAIRWVDDGVPSEVIEEVGEVIDNNFQYPVFIRTDLLSGKHDYQDTCLVSDRETLEGNLWKLNQEHFLAMMRNGNELTAFLVREYLDIKSEFTAFYADLPIGVEVRHFIKDGEWENGHYYWPKDSIRQPSVENWKELIDDMMVEAIEGFKKHKGLAELVGEAIGGDWSIDFAKTEDGIWYLIDMAKYEDSYKADDSSIYFEEKQ